MCCCPLRLLGPVFVTFVSPTVTVLGGPRVWKEDVKFRHTLCYSLGRGPPCQSHAHFVLTGRKNTTPGRNLSRGGKVQKNRKLLKVQCVSGVDYENTVPPAWVRTVRRCPKRRGDGCWAGPRSTINRTVPVDQSLVPDTPNTRK